MRTNREQTTASYSALDAAYDHLNATLFGGALPACLITWQRKTGTYGYFSPERFQGMYGEDVTDEIALNPAHFKEQTQIQILQTLAHEMVHLWQQHFGKPPRRSYHNRQWARMMEEIGLMPSQTGKPGGKPIGQKMADFIISGGRFEKAAQEIITRGNVVMWADKPDENNRRKKAASKTKYTCPSCGINAWAKPGTRLCCEDCLDANRSPFRLVAEEADEADDD